MQQSVHREEAQLRDVIVTLCFRPLDGNRHVSDARSGEGVVRMTIVLRRKCEHIGGFVDSEVSRVERTQFCVISETQCNGGA